MSQNQHIIPQVYLRKFGYKTPNNHWKISVLELDKFQLMDKINKKWISQKFIKGVCSKPDEFDLSFHSIDDNRKLYENFNSQLENYYLSILETFENCELLSSKLESAMVQLIANIFSRTERARRLIKDLYFNDATRSFFLNEITQFHDDYGKRLKSEIIKLNEKDTINILALVIWYFLINKLIEFDYFIIKSKDGMPWLTSDCPVCLFDSITPETILSKETTIIFPYSPDYLIYFCHGSRKSNLELEKNYGDTDIYDTSEKVINDFNMKISRHAFKLVFFPCEINWD